MSRTPVEIIVALERECLGVDKAIAAQDWEACDASWTQQRRMTHELDIAMRETPPADPVPVFKRIKRLTNYRDAQLKRLTEFNEAIATRLAQAGRFRSFQKTNDLEERRSALIDVNS
jgi:hypothetical protein